MMRTIKTLAPLFLLSFAGALGCQAPLDSDPDLAAEACHDADDPECAVASDPQSLGAADPQSLGAAAAPEGALARVAADALQALSQARNSDEALLELERRLPSLGGLYLGEDSVTHILLTEGATTEEHANARAVGLALARQHAAALGQTVPPVPTKVERARHRFSELVQIRDRAKDLLAIGGILTLDADERTNHVSVGVASEEAAEKTRRFWMKQGLPRVALRVFVQEEFHDLATLDSYIRPTPGGYAIQRGDGGTCTLGYPVYSHAQAMWGFVTNSHCSDNEGTLDYTAFKQGGQYLATEYMDAPYQTSAHFAYPACPDGRVCRYSDATFAGAPGYGNGAFGTIANPINYCALPQTHCSTTVNSSSPTNTPRTFASSPLVGQHFEKIGRTTGWTYGPINQTCVHVNKASSNMTMLCEYTVDAGAAQGDSGSPVFTWDGTKNPIGGILWGGNSSNTNFVFSDYIGIADELGPMSYHY